MIKKSKTCMESEMKKLSTPAKKKKYPNPKQRVAIGLNVCGLSKYEDGGLIEHKIGWHVSKSENSDSIKNNGLKPDKEGRVYLWLDKYYADWFKSFKDEDNINTDIWKIDITNLKLKRDPESENMNDWSSEFQEGEFGQAYIYNGSIPNSRIIKKIKKKYDKGGKTDDDIEEITQLIDIIDIDPSNEKYAKYKKVLKEKYNVDYIEPSIRYKKENDLLEKYFGVKKVKTDKGLDITISLYKTPNLDKSITIDVFDDSFNKIAGAGVGIDLESKTIRVGGVSVKDNMRRKGIYSAMMDIIEKISKDNNLTMQEKGRSQDAQNFWKARNSNIKYDKGGKVKTDKSGNYIGDGRYHVEYSTFDFSEYPQIDIKVNKSETTESVYVTYKNNDNGKSIILRFSTHENNAVKFGDQLNGNLASKNEVLYKLGLMNRKFIPKKRLFISWKQPKKVDLDKYEVADKTMKELYDLGENADISMYKGKLAKGSNYLITGDKIESSYETRLDAFGNEVRIGDYIYESFEKGGEIKNNNWGLNNLIYWWK